MRVCIHRGAAEIGGSCVEVEQDRFRLILDLGRPLRSDLDDGTGLPLLKELDGLHGGASPWVSGIVVSHGHIDHWGLVPLISEEIPIICGEGTARTLTAASFFSLDEIDFRPA